MAMHWGGAIAVQRLSKVERLGYETNTKTPTLTDRRFDSYTGCKQTGIVLGFGECLEAGSAEFLGYNGATIKHFHFLNVHIPFVAGGLLGPGPVVAKLGAFATLLTLCHNFFAPLLSYVRSFPPLIVLFEHSFCVGRRT